MIVRFTWVNLLIGTELFPIAAHTHTSNWNCVNVDDCG